MTMKELECQLLCTWSTGQELQVYVVYTNYYRNCILYYMKILANTYNYYYYVNYMHTVCRAVTKRCTDLLPITTRLLIYSQRVS